MAPDPGLSSTDVARIAGISYRQLDYWARSGYARPLVDAQGCGSQRRWSEEEADVLGHMSRLRRAGHSLDQARAIAEALVAGDHDRVMEALGLGHMALAYELRPVLSVVA